MPHARILILAAALAAPALGQGTDLPYATDHPSQVFDWYLPSDPGAPYPVVIYIHGGPGDKAEAEPAPGNLPHLMTTNGIAVLSINLHPWPEFQYPTQLEDTATAVQYFRENAATLSIDPQRLAIWGNSSGAILGGWLAYGPDLADPAGSSQEQQSTRPQALFNEAGLTNFLLMQPAFPSVFLFGATLGDEDPAFLASVSVSLMVVDVPRAFTPPVVSYYGEKETPPPLWDPHDATLMKDLHAHLETAYPDVWADSLMVQKFTGITYSVYHQIMAWLLVPLQVGHQLDVGKSLAGTGGVAPELVATGDWSPGGVATLSFQGSLAASTPFWIVAGANAINLPFKGGTLVPAPDVPIILQTARDGSLSLDLTLPPSLAPGEWFYLQALQPDEGAPHGVALSNAVMAKIVP